MNKELAQNILETAEQEMIRNGEVGYDTVIMMENAVGKAFTNYFYPEGNRITFNSRLWKRHFLEDK